MPTCIDNVIVVAERQTQGQGTGKNEWLSPKGCCMFSLFFACDSSTFPIERLCLLQFAAALACVKTIQSSSKHLDNDLFGVKWPNDVFFKKRIKLGGTLVKTTIQGQQVLCKIGVGFNLNNQLPTTCFNQILKEESKREVALQDDNCDAHFSPEQFIAGFINEFELLKQQLSSKSDVRSLESFLEQFEANWIHK